MTYKKRSADIMGKKKREKEWKKEKKKKNEQKNKHSTNIKWKVK